MCVRRLIALLLVVAVALGACGGRRREADKAEDREARVRAAAAIEGLDTIPAEAEVVVGANVARLAGSPLVRRVLSEALARTPGGGARLLALFTRCKLDPAKDLESVLVGLARAGSRRDVILTAKGRFDEPTLVGCVRESLIERGGTLDEQTRLERKVYVARPTDGDPIQLAFGAPGVIILATSEEWLTKAIDPAVPKLRTAAATMAWLQATDTRAALWGAGVLGPDIGKRLPAVTGGKVSTPAKAIYGHVELNEGLGAELNLEMASADDARGLADFASAQLGNLAMMAQIHALGGIVHKIQPSHHDATFRVRLALDASEVAQLESALATMAGDEAGRHDPHQVPEKEQAR